MKRAVLAALVLSSLAPVSVYAQATTPTTKQANCIPIIIDGPDGPLEGAICIKDSGGNW